MAPKRKPVKDRHKNLVTVRLTDEQLRLLRADAKTSKVSVGELIRRRCLL